MLSVSTAPPEAGKRRKNPRYKKVYFLCEGCGQWCRRKASGPLPTACSIECRGIRLRKKMGDITGTKGKLAYELRRAGLLWREIGEELFPRYCQPATAALSCAKKWKERCGL